MKKTKVLIFGPHAEEYSLAKVNRHLAIALHQEIKKQNLPFEVKVSGTEETVARLPEVSDYKRYPELQEVYTEFDPEFRWDVLIYNNFPKDSSKLHGLAEFNARVKIAYLAWEEDRFPERWVNEYNDNLDLILAATQHTLRLLKMSGVKVPIIVVPNALMPEFLAEGGDTYSVKSKKSFKFLHNSSGMERKGARELIAAFTNEFSAQDDVALVIKSFPNPNNLFREAISNVKRSDAPEIELIETDSLTDAEVKSLYMQTDSYVSPSKAEGFNLPVLEAMYLERPVITTAWSGQMDFCSDETAYLVDYELVPAKSHLDNPGAYWAEVSVEDLQKKLRASYEERGTDRQAQQVANAKKIAAILTWENSAKSLLSDLSKFVSISKAKNIRLGVVSTFNTVCGIAEYSSYLYGPSANSFKEFYIFANKDAVGRVKVDGPEVSRLWEYGEVDFSTLLDALPELDIVHIQYSEGFYTLDALSKLIDGLNAKDVKVVLTAHSVQVEGAELAQIADKLKTVAQIHVLNTNDAKHLRSLGLDNVIFLPHGNITFPFQSKERLRRKFGIAETAKPVLATHGFMSEGKGIIETLEGIALIKQAYPDFLYLAVNSVNPRNMTSQGMSDAFDAKVKQFGLQDNVLHISEFIDREDIILALAAADIVIFAYPEAKQTASGAVRLAMAAGRDIIASDSFQLRDLADIAYMISGNKPETIARAITELLEDKEKYFDYELKVRVNANKNSWDNISLDYINYLAELAAPTAEN